MKQVTLIGQLNISDSIISFRLRDMCIRSGKYVDIINVSKCWRLCNRSFNSCCFGARVPDIKTQKIPLVKITQNGGYWYFPLTEIKNIEEIE